MPIWSGSSSGSSTTGRTTALAWVNKYLEDGRPEQVTDSAEQALFLDKDGGPLSKRAVSALGKKILKRADLGKSGAAHVFRHSAATAMLEGGADVRFVQELLGHASLLSTQVYTRVAISKLKAVHAATHPGAKLGRPEGEREQEPDGTPGGGGDGDEAAEPPENQ